MKLNDLKRLAIFSHIVEQGSLTAAARHLRMGRSAVSEQLTALEASLGIRLLNRSTRNITPTVEGQAIYQQARRINDVLISVTELTEKEEPKGRVCVTATYDFAERWLIPTLPALLEHYPDIRLDLRLSDTPVDLITSGVDLAFRIGRPRDENLIARPIARENPIAIASQRYINKRGIPSQPDELSSHTWVLLEHLNQNNKVTLTGPEGTYEFSPEDYHFADSPIAARVMIECGLGIGLHLPNMVQAQLHNGELVKILPEYHEEMLTYSLVYPSRKHLPMRTRCVIDFFLNHTEKRQSNLLGFS